MTSAGDARACPGTGDLELPASLVTLFVSVCSNV